MNTDWYVVSAKYAISYPVSGPEPTEAETMLLVEHLLDRCGHKAAHAFLDLELWSATEEEDSGDTRWKRETGRLKWPDGRNTGKVATDGGGWWAPEWACALVNGALDRLLHEMEKKGVGQQAEGATAAV